MVKNNPIKDIQKKTRILSKGKFNLWHKILFVFFILTLTYYRNSYKASYQNYQGSKDRYDRCQEEIKQVKQDKNVEILSLSDKLDDLQKTRDSHKQQLEELKPRVASYETIADRGLYQSKHGFSLKYPQDWYIDIEPLEKYDSIGEATKVGANHFNIVNFDTSERHGAPLTSPDVKLEGSVEWGNTQTISEKIENVEDIISYSEIQTSGGLGIKISKKEYTHSDQSLTYYIPHKNMALTLVCYPYDTEHLHQIEGIIRSIKFSY